MRRAVRFMLGLYERTPLPGRYYWLAGVMVRVSCWAGEHAGDNGEGRCDACGAVMDPELAAWQDEFEAIMERERVTGRCGVQHPQTGARCLMEPGHGHEDDRRPGDLIAHTWGDEVVR